MPAPSIFESLREETERRSDPYSIVEEEGGFGLWLYNPRAGYMKLASYKTIPACVESIRKRLPPIEGPPDIVRART